jgi:hypothetical protein
MGMDIVDQQVTSSSYWDAAAARPDAGAIGIRPRGA